MSAPTETLKALNHTITPGNEVEQTGSSSKTSEIEGKKDNTSPDSLGHLLNRKIKKEKMNRESCSICRDGGDLLLCDNCPKSFHLFCLKLKQTDIPSGNWYCPTCLPKIQKKKENLPKTHNLDKESERKRLIKNEKRRLWRLKKKEMLKNSNKANSKTIESNLLKSGGNMLIDSFLSNYKIKNTPIKHTNSNICLNFTYLSNLSNNNNNETITKALSLPLLFPIPNNTNVKMNENTIQLNESIELFNSQKKMMSLYFPITDKDIMGRKMIMHKKEDIEKFAEKTLSEILKCPNSINSVNTLIEHNESNLYLYNEIVRKYWNTILEKKNNKHPIKFPIEDKELFSMPDIYGITSYNLSKPEGEKMKIIPCKYICDIIQIYDFIITFSQRLFITKFTMEELYIALKYSSNEYQKEIPLISEIYSSLIRILLDQLMNNDLYELFLLGDLEVMLLKIIIDSSPENTLNDFISNSWPEIVYLLLSSATFNTNSEMFKTYKKLKCINIQNFNSEFSLDEKIELLKHLILTCYETDIIRNFIKEEQEKRNEIRKNKRDLEEEMRVIDSRKRELERQEKFTQPQMKIEQLTKRLSTLSEDNQGLSRYQLGKLRKELEYERDQFKSVIKEIDSIEGKRNDIMNKIEKLQNEIVDLATVNKKFIGVDGKGYQFFYFPWIKDTIFIKRLNNHNYNDNDNTDSKYEWRTLKGEEEIKDLISKLTEKGIKENNLKNKIIKIFQRRILSNKKDKETLQLDELNVTEEEIFNNRILKYINASNKSQRKPLSIEEEYHELSIKFNSLEEMITHYLSNDSKEWESFIVRENIKAWITCINNIKHYCNLLKLFNERNKSPYKINSSLNQNIKNVIVDEEEEYSPFDTNGNLDFSKINPHETLAIKTKLWSKDFDSFSLEQIYLNYLDQVESFPMVYVALYFFKALCVDLGKRRDFYKRKIEEHSFEFSEIKDENDNEQTEFKDDEVLYTNSNSNKYSSRLRKRNAINVNGKNSNGFNSQSSTEKKKGKKMIDWNETCMFCNDFGDLICCEDCPNVSHLECAGLGKIPEVWRCQKCIYNLANRRITRSITGK